MTLKTVVVGALVAESVMFWHESLKGHSCMQHETVDQPGQRSRVEAFIGGLLFVPALLYGLMMLLWPTLQTLSTSFQKVSMFDEGVWVGLENYQALLGNPQFVQAFGFTALLIGMRLLILVVVLPLLIWAFRQISRRGGSALLWLFGLPLALFSPTALAIAWRVRLAEAGNITLASPNTARLALVGIDALLTFGIVLGLGAVCAYLLSQRQPGGRMRKSPALVTLCCGVFAVIALGLQSLSFSMLLTGGGPQNATQTLALLSHKFSFQLMDFGASATLNTILILIVAVLGVLATILLISNEVQIAPSSSREEPLSGVGQIVAAMVLALLLLICLFGLGPLWNAMRSTSGLLALFGVPNSPSELLTTEDVLRTWSLSLVPSLLSVLVVQVPFTYLTALAIGLLRPLGRRSEWLLLLLAPWLFMTEFPLTPTFFEQYRMLGLLNSLVVILPPFLLCIPGVFVLTLFFKGYAPRWRAARQQQEPYAFLRLVLFPSLPLVVLLGVGLLIVQSRVFYWPLVMINSPDMAVGSVQLMQLVARYYTNPAEVSSLLAALSLHFSLVWFVLLSLMLAFGLRGLHLRAGAEQPIVHHVS